MTADNNPHAIATADQLKAARAAVDAITDLQRRVEELERHDKSHLQHLATVNITITNLIEMNEQLKRAIYDLRRRP